MSMTRAEKRRGGSLLRRAAMVFAACAAACWLLAPREAKPRRAPPSLAAVEAVTALASSAKPKVSEEIQQLLAAGGCPGWIALAGDPALIEKLDREPPVVDPAKVRLLASRTPTSLRPPTPQQISNPYVLELARLPEPTAEKPLVAASDPDELIPESDDLYLPDGDKTTEISPAPADDDAEKAVESELSSEPAEKSDVEPAPIVESPPERPAETPAKPPTAPPQPLPPTDETPETAVSAPERLPQPEAMPEAKTPADATPAVGKPAEKETPRETPAVPKPALDPSLFGPQPGTQTPPANPAAPAAKPAAPKKDDWRSKCEFAAAQLYPSATACRSCHEKIYEEWSISSHAYSAVSPMFHKFEQKINDIASGTIGYFCMRCHSQVGTSLGFSRAAPIWDAPAAAREGVTCVVCHRVNEMYGKTNGERRIEPGPIYAPVYGTLGGDGVAAVAAQKSTFKVKTSPQDPGPGQDMHAAGFTFPQLAASEFCMSCHQVAVHPGIKLEVVWEQYRASPACKKGIQCQACHMGRIPGVPSGYEIGPAAVINNKPAYVDRRHSNHVFYGPGYSIAHPGVFPFNPKADRWPMRDWLLFDWRAGWGTDAFEDAVKAGRIYVDFPPVWKNADDRADAREIIEENLKKKQTKDQLRGQVMENGSHVDGPFFKAPPTVGKELKFEFIVTNTNEGHNLPTASLGAQPQLWANLVLIGPDGRRLWESGYLDRLGDLADIHSVEVRNKQLSYDWQLFNLQTMFLITGAKGTDREFFLPVNIDIDPLPFIRPAPQPVSVINHPPFIRMEARSLAPLGSRRVPYRVPAEVIRQPGRYRLSFRMRSRTEPLYFMRFCESTPDMQRSMIEGTLDFHQSSVEFEVR